MEERVRGMDFSHYGRPHAAGKEQYTLYFSQCTLKAGLVKIQTQVMVLLKE
jgi:hypothetical protein